MAMREVRAYYALEVRTGKEILVTPDMLLSDPGYRNAVNYVKLDKPVPADTPDAVKMAKPAKRSTALKKPAEKPATKKSTAKKKASK